MDRSTPDDSQTGPSGHLSLVQPPPPTQVQAAAREAVQRGFTPVPLKAGTKSPSVPGWAQLTRDRYQSRPVEEEFPAGAGIGLVLGEPSGGLVDIDLDHPEIARIARLIFPPTAMRHGRDGFALSHLWYRVTDTPPPKTVQWLDPTITGTGDKRVILELRTTGGQTMIPPSVHPTTEEPLQWIGHPFGGDEGPRAVTAIEIQWWAGLAAMMYHLIQAGIGTEGIRHQAYLALAGGLLRWSGHPNQPHEVWEHFLPQTIDWLCQLTDDDQSRSRECVDSTITAIREGKNVQGFPTLRQLLGDDQEPHLRRVIEISRQLELLQGYEWAPDESPDPKAQVSDWVAETLDYSSDETGETDDPLKARGGSSWRSVSLGQWQGLDLTPPQPDLLKLDDGTRGLIYPGMVNLLFGKSNIGKSWIGMWLLTQHLQQPDRPNAMYVDLEDSPQSTIRRLRSLGATWSDIERVSYVQPDSPMAHMLLTGQHHASALKNAEAFWQDLKATDPSLIIIDGMTMLYGLHGLDTNHATDTDKIATWLKTMARAGRTVVVIDHESKSAVKGAMPSGSQHKTSMAQGVVLQLWCTQKPKIGGQAGEYQIVSIKDRHGEVSRHSVGDPEAVADVTVQGDEHSVTVSLRPPTGQVTIDNTSGVETKAERDAKKLAGIKAAAITMMTSLQKPHGWSAQELHLSLPPSIKDQISYRTFAHQLSKWWEAGDIDRTGTTKNTRYWERGTSPDSDSPDSE